MALRRRTWVEIVPSGGCHLRPGLATAKKERRVLKTCYEMNADRVRIAHGFWIITEDFGELYHGPKGKLDPIAHFNNAASIASEADLASRLNRQLSANLRNKL